MDIFFPPTLFMSSSCNCPKSSIGKSYRSCIGIFCRDSVRSSRRYSTGVSLEILSENASEDFSGRCSGNSHRNSSVSSSKISPVKLFKYIYNSGMDFSESCSRYSTGKSFWDSSGSVSRECPTPCSIKSYYENYF